jgi:hypothetical protein
MKIPIEMSGSLRVLLCVCMFYLRVRSCVIERVRLTACMPRASLCLLARVCLCACVRAYMQVTSGVRVCARA